MPELILNNGVFENLSDTDSIHEVIFNRLDIPHRNNGNEYRYNPNEVRKALEEFRKTYVIFAEKHPTNIGKLPLWDALKEVEGKLVGSVHNIFVNDNDTLLRGAVKIDDLFVNQLIKEGKALLSTAFTGSPDRNGDLYNITPNHILIYPLATNILPGDGAALFLNQDVEPKTRDTNMAENEADLAVAQVTIQNQATEIEGLKATIAELEEKRDKQKVLIKNQSDEFKKLEESITGIQTEKDKLEVLVSNQATEIEKITTELGSAKTQLAEFIETKKRDERDMVFNQYLEGTKTHFDARKEEIYSDDTFVKLIFEMNQYQAQALVPNTTVSGTVDVQNQEEDEDAKWLNGVESKYDPKTGQFVTKPKGA